VKRIQAFIILSRDPGWRCCGPLKVLGGDCVSPTWSSAGMRGLGQYYESCEDMIQDYFVEIIL